METHSLRNILNVLLFNVTILAQSDASLNGDAKLVEDQIMKLAEACCQFQSTVDSFANLQAQYSVLSKLLQPILRNPNPLLREYQVTIERITEQNNRRLSEIDARINDPKATVTEKGSEMVSRLQGLFKTVESNSHGKYGIAFKDSDWQPNSYLFIFQGLSDYDSLHYRYRLRESLIDLLMNARKYSKPGSVICLRHEQESLTDIWTIADKGRGIPKNEVPLVVKAGYRGSNVQDKNTSAGGYGLTKALWFTSSVNGQLKINSEEGVGTTISLFLPKN